MSMEEGRHTTDTMFLFSSLKCMESAGSVLDTMDQMSSSIDFH